MGRLAQCYNALFSESDRANQNQNSSVFMATPLSGEKHKEKEKFDLDKLKVTSLNRFIKLISYLQNLFHTSQYATQVKKNLSSECEQISRKL